MMKQGWEYKKLGDCFPYIKNGANIKQIKDADGLSITRIETLSGGVFNRDRMGYAGIYNLDKYSDYVLEDGDLLMSHINSKTYIGRTVEYRAKNGETIIHGMNLLRLKSNSEIINSSYFAYYTLSNDFKANVAKVRKDAVNQSSIAISDIKRFSLPVPSIQTQQYVVDEFDKINELIRLKKEQLRDYDKLAQSLFYEMFGDPVENEKGWEVKKLGDVCEEIKYGTSKPACEDGKYKYLRMCNLSYDGYLDLADVKTINIPDEEIEKCIVRYGDILFNRTNSLELIGKTCMFDQIEPMVIAGYIIRVRLNDELMPVVLARMFNLPSIKKLLRNMAKGAVNQANINSKELASIQIPLPPLPLQQLFAQRIEAIEKQKAQVKAAIEKLETLLAARMQYWFE